MTGIAWRRTELSHPDEPLIQSYERVLFVLQRGEDGEWAILREMEDQAPESAWLRQSRIEGLYFDE